MTDLRTLAEVAEERRTTPLVLLRFCHRHAVPVYRFNKKSPWLFSVKALAILNGIKQTDKPPEYVAKAKIARDRATELRHKRRAALALVFEENLIQESEIIAKATKWKAFGTGIYFLIKRGRIVYVGQAINVLARVNGHVATKDFDAWHWIPCPRARLGLMERIYINAFLPPLNRDFSTLRLRSSRDAEGVSV